MRRVLLAIAFEIDGLKPLPEIRRVSGSMWEGSVGMGEERFERIYCAMVWCW